MDNGRFVGPWLAEARAAPPLRRSASSHAIYMSQPEVVAGLIQKATHEVESVTV